MNRRRKTTYTAWQIMLSCALPSVCVFTITGFLMPQFLEATAGSIQAFDVILVPAGGQKEDGPPPHVKLRLIKAAELYRLAPADKKVHRTPFRLPVPAFSYLVVCSPK
jgi:hypothetical protein